MNIMHKLQNFNLRHIWVNMDLKEIGWKGVDWIDLA
jgi:hypothetical protein